MTAEVTGRLIEMNAKMVVTGRGLTMIIAGVVLAVVFLMGTLAGWLDNKKRWWLCLVGAAVFAALAVMGYRMPRVKEIHACADGPISLERVGAVYEIVGIDGKELILRVR